MTASDKFITAWERFFIISGNIVFFIAFCVLLATDDQVHRDAANRWLFPVNLLILLILCVGSLFLQKKKNIKWKHPVLFLLGIYLVLFILQCILVHFTYFYTGWDVDLMKWRVEGILSGYSLQDLGGDDYLSISPNNLLLFYMQYLLAKIGEIFSLEHPYNLCIYFSCFCVSAACFFGNLVVRKVTQNSFIRLLYHVAGTVFILFCPWIVIPYSDTYGMLFVALGLWAVCCLEKPVFKWPVLAFAALIGYHIKPTCVLTLLAALILFLPQLLIEFRKNLKEVGILLLSCLLFFGAAQGIAPFVQHSLNFRLYPERRLPAVHFVLMGLNPDTKGGFSPEDFEFTTDIPTYEEKKRLVREEIEFRWNQMTLSQKREHFVTKFIYILNDGTFSWSNEGIFFYNVPEHDNWLNDVYLMVFHPEGKYFTLYCEIAQIIWLQILLGILFLFLDLKRQTSGKAFLCIALCGLLAFLMLFEARARYLILYSPAFLILALHGYEGLFSMLSEKFNKKKEPPDAFIKG